MNVGLKKKCFFNFLQKVRAYQTNFFTKRLSFIALKSSKFRKLIFYIWNSFPSKISAALANVLRLLNNFSFSFLVYSCDWRRFIILSNDKSLELDLKNKEGNIKKSMNALRLSLVITEFSWHILIRKRRSIKKMYSKRNLHRLITNSAYRTNFNKTVIICCLQSWYHTKRCRISEPISLWHTFYLDRPKISAVATNSLRFFK